MTELDEREKELLEKVDATIDVDLVDLKNLIFKLSFSLTDKIPNLYEIFLYKKIKEIKAKTIDRNSLAREYIEFRKNLCIMLLEKVLKGLREDENYKKMILDIINELLVKNYLSEKPAKDLGIKKIEIDANGFRIYVIPIFK